MRLRGEAIVFSTGAADIVQRVLGHGMCEVMVVQDPSGDYTIGHTYTFNDSDLRSGSPGEVVRRADTSGAVQSPVAAAL